MGSLRLRQEDATSSTRSLLYRLRSRLTCRHTAASVGSATSGLRFTCTCSAPDHAAIAVSQVVTLPARACTVSSAQKRSNRFSPGVLLWRCLPDHWILRKFCAGPNQQWRCYQGAS